MINQNESKFKKKKIESVQPKIDKTLYTIKAYEGKKIYLKKNPDNTFL